MIFVRNPQRVDGKTAVGKTDVLTHLNEWYCKFQVRCGDHSDGTHDGALLLGACLVLLVCLCVRFDITGLICRLHLHSFDILTGCADSICGMLLKLKGVQNPDVKKLLFPESVAGSSPSGVRSTGLRTLWSTAPISILRHSEKGWLTMLLKHKRWLRSM